MAMLFGMAISGAAAVGLERVAYRPLRRRGAKPLTFLITAIGMSFVIQEFVHFVLPKFVDGLGGTQRATADQAGRPEDAVRDLRRPGHQRDT